MIAEARRRGASEVLLEVREDNDAARGLYASEGFTVLGRRRGYYEQGRVDAVTMRYLVPGDPVGSQQSPAEVTRDEG
jgi:ribosomal-protein-alanine N-acetyltransferase